MPLRDFARLRTPQYLGRSHGDSGSAALRGKRLLLVEDNEVNQEFAVEILREAGAAVDVAGNGREALERMAESTYDAVLMDCQMPVMDGFEATRQIRRDRRNAMTPVIAMTANAMAGERERCLEAGMNDHVAKPIDVAVLFATLRKWLEPQRAANEAMAPTAVVVGPGPAAGTTRAPARPTTAAPRATSDSGQALPGPAPAPALDLASALLRIGGNQGLLDRLAARFLQTEANAAQRIADALAGGDRETANRAAHTLKACRPALARASWRSAPPRSRPRCTRRRARRSTSHSLRSSRRCMRWLVSSAHGCRWCRARPICNRPLLRSRRSVPRSGTPSTKRRSPTICADWRRLSPKPISRPPETSTE